MIFEAAPEAGGWLRYGIPEYRLPREVLKQEVDYIQRCGVQINYNTPIGGDRTIKKLLTKDGFNAVFIGVGAQDSIRLPVPGADAQGVLWGVEYPERLGHGQKARSGRQESGGHRRRQRGHGRGPHAPGARMPMSP